MLKIKTALIIGSTALLAAACGDDGTPDTTDTIPGDLPDNCGHGCVDPATDPINLPEGGEIRLEIVKDKDGRGEEVRTHAWFASDQTPATRPFNRDPETWGTTVEVSNEFPGGVCTDMRSKTMFPNGMPPERTYISVGDTINLKSANSDITYDRFEPMQDQVSNNVHDIGYYVDFDPADVELDAEYVVTLGADLLGGRDLYMPPSYAVTYPDLTQTVLMPAGENFPFQWDDMGDDINDGFLYGFVAFGDALGINYFCVVPNKGIMEVPAVVIDDLPVSGWVQHGLLSHRPVANADGDRRIDLLGVTCNQGQYTRVAAQ